MGRIFDTDAKYLDTNSCPKLGATEGTVALWFKPSWAYNDGVYHVLANIISGSNQFQIHKRDANDWCVGWYPNGEKRLFVSAAGINQSQWNLLVIDYIGSPERTRIFINNILKGTAALCGIWDTTNATIHVGNHTSAGYASGCTMAHWMAWDRMLTLAERTLLWSNPAGGANSIADLIYHYPIGVASPDTDTEGGASMTVNGSAATADGPGEETLTVNGLVSQVVREVLADVGCTAYVSQVVREVLASVAIPAPTFLAAWATRRNQVIGGGVI